MIISLNLVTLFPTENMVAEGVIARCLPRSKRPIDNNNVRTVHRDYLLQEFNIGANTLEYLGFKNIMKMECGTINGDVLFDLHSIYPNTRASLQTDKLNYNCLRTPYVKKEVVYFL